MIYLIDDTPIQMLEGYLRLSDYASIFRRLDSIPIDDVPSLSGASCVLMHSSYGDSTIKRRVLDVLDCGEVAPVVLFSDGDSEEAKFNGDNYIISIKKSVLYSRLPRFLKEYRKSGVVNLKILAGEKPVPEKRSMPIPGNNVFSEFFSRISLDFTSEKEETTDGPCIYCIGREGMSAIAGKLGGSYIRINATSFNTDDSRLMDISIHDFLMASICREAKMFILDTDFDPRLLMLLAMHIRLTETIPGKSKYAPIVFISDFSLEKLVKKGTGAQIFMTEGTYLCRRSEIEGKLGSFKSLDEESERSDFLDRINIPVPKGSNHSLANQWGASRLYMIINGDNARKEAFKDFQDIHKRLYFKYISHKIIAGESPLAMGKPSFQVKGATGKRVLLIDDEAEKGWSRVLSNILPSARFNPADDVISETVMDYDSFSTNARSKIEERNYDLILLDLRLGGIREDYIVDPQQMSGYKVLQRIKQLNRGTQVVMLTASNKAWNLKAIMNSSFGADGYFVKESPEYEFSDELSAANLRSLISDMEKCFNQGYLRDYWPFVHGFDGAASILAGEVKTQLEIAYGMAAKAEKPDDFRYAFLALYQALEIITSKLTDWQIDTTGHDTKLLQLPDGNYAKELVPPTGKDILWSFKQFAFHKVPKNGTFPQKDKLAALYLQTWGLNDRGLLFLMDQLIAIRNSLIHPDNAKLFETIDPIREGAFLQNPYFRDETYVFGSPMLKPLFREASSKNLLFTDSNKRPVLHRDITASQVGIRILFSCLKEILPHI